MTGCKASGYTSSSSSRNSLASTRPINRYDGLESSCCMDNNLPISFLTFRDPIAPVAGRNPYRREFKTLNTRPCVYRTSALPTERLPFPLFPIHELSRVRLPELQQRLAIDPPVHYDTRWW